MRESAICTAFLRGGGWILILLWSVSKILTAMTRWFGRDGRW